MTYPEKYAIAIADSGSLYLFLGIRRSRAGDIYVNFNENYPGHKPHSSYHSSGQHHHKSHNSIMTIHTKHRHPPDNNFRGSENIITTLIRHGDGKAWNKVCKPENYNEVMVIADEIITPEFGYQLAIDIVQYGSLPEVSTQIYNKIIQQKTFDKKKPLIVASLYEALRQIKQQ